MGFFSSIRRLGSKAIGGIKAIGKKVVDIGSRVGRKVVSISGDVSDIAGSIAKYGALALPAVAGIPIVGEAYAGALGLAAGVSAGAGAINKFAGGATKALQAGDRLVRKGDISGAMNLAKGQAKAARDLRTKLIIRR